MSIGDYRASQAVGREWPPLDDVTLFRLTWLWLAYSMFALATGGVGCPRYARTASSHGTGARCAG